VQHKKQLPKITFREWHNLNYLNLQRLLLRDFTQDSENFIYIFSWKQRLQLSKMESVILQVNTRYYRDCYTKDENKTHGINLKRRASSKFISS